MLKQSLLENSTSQLKQCLSLAQEVSRHEQASEEFERLRDRVMAECPQSVELIDLLWNEVLAARRSSTFWREMCDVEKQLSERIAQSHSQLKQNYLRLMQEQ